MPESAGVNCGVRSQAGQGVKPERNYKKIWIALRAHPYSALE
jgi:hypothetical protein